MNTKFFIKIFAIFLLLGFLGFTLVLLRGEEDAWICNGVQWTEHGHPRAPMPNKPCGEPKKTTTNFIECSDNGFLILKSNPRQCQDGDGNIFTEIGTTTEAKIILDNPKPEQNVSSPLVVSGQARGSWFFEGSFPVTLTNWDGLIIAETSARAEGDWMSEDFVPFTATLNFKNDSAVSNRGSLILKKDNPSGLPENDDYHEITVFFK